MHDATSRMEGMHHVNRTMCHEEGINCVNGGLGHMGIGKKDMAMHEGSINDQRPYVLRCRAPHELASIVAYIYATDLWRRRHS